MSTRVHLEIGELVLPGVPRAQLPVVLQQLEARLVQTLAGADPQALASLHLAELRLPALPAGATPVQVGDALADGLVGGPLASPAPPVAP